MFHLLSMFVTTHVHAW